MQETERALPGGPAHIFIVDDEEMVLASVRGFLKLEAPQYRLDCCTDPRQALTAIQQESPDLIIADYLMPEMDGIEFLAQARHIAPEATRILLTGYADKESAIRAINEVDLFQYIEKPWDNGVLLLAIRNGLEKRLLLRQLREMLDELGDAHQDLREAQKRLLRAFI